MNVLPLLGAEPAVRVEAVDGDGELTVPGRAALIAQAFSYVFLYLYALGNGGLQLAVVGRRNGRALRRLGGWVRRAAVGSRLGARLTGLCRYSSNAKPNRTFQ